MEYTTLGRTNLTVSVMGLGCGGHSRLGLATGKTETEAIQVVQKALDLGINFIDTAEAYGTEVVVGKAICGQTGQKRENIIVSTKLSAQKDGAFSTPEAFSERFHGSLARLQTDYIDILHLHGVQKHEYDYCLHTLVPEMQKLRAAGKIRFIAISEAFIPDPQHRMLLNAIEDNCWDVMMVGFNLLNPTARNRVFPTTQEKGIGTLCMFACRRALSQPEVLHELLTELIADGKIETGAGTLFPPTLTPEELTTLAYRFCRHEPGVNIVLSGTGNPAHLEANAKSLLAPLLPIEMQEQLSHYFGNLDSVSGN